MNTNKLILRATSGIIYIAIIIGCIFCGQIAFSCMAALFATIATIEFKKITLGLGSQVIPSLAFDIAGVVCLTFGWKLTPLPIWVIIIICRLIFELYSKRDTHLYDLANSFMSQIYIGLPLGFMTATAFLWNTNIILAIFIMIWINDTGAFLVGSTIGKHRLFEKVSPKKSWEGFWGGLMFNLAISWLFFLHGQHFFCLDWQIYQWLGLGAVVTIFSTWGDLVESMIKRSLHIKDSGNIIPGHGGILDRIDSLLMVMPASLIYLIFIA